MNAAGDYADWWQVSQGLLAHLSTVQRQQVMGENAAAVYKVSAN